MTLDTVESMTLLVLAFVAIAILLRILVAVHGQTRHVNELEMRMKAMEKMELEGVEPHDKVNHERKKG